MDIQSGYDLYAVFEGFKHRGIALDASLRSAIDGFSSDTRDQILRRLLKEADRHHSVVAAFTQEDVYLEKTTARSDRKLMLWQDIRDDRSNLYTAANAAQQLLSNIGCNRYRADIVNRIYQHTFERTKPV